MQVHPQRPNRKRWRCVCAAKGGASRPPRAVLRAWSGKGFTIKTDRRPCLYTFLKVDRLMGRRSSYLGGLSTHPCSLIWIMVYKAHVPRHVYMAHHVHIVYNISVYAMHTLFILQCIQSIRCLQCTHCLHYIPGIHCTHCSISVRFIQYFSMCIVDLVNFVNAMCTLCQCVHCRRCTQR